MPVHAPDLKGQLVVAYDGRCAACSGLAQHITVYRLDGVAVAERNSAALHKHLKAHGLNAPPNRPYVVTPGGRRRPAAVRTGLRMRIAMARALGVRHFVVAVRLLTAETRARSSRTSAR